MGIRKISTFILIIVISFSSYVYLSDKYNPAGVEMYLSSNIQYEEIKKLKKKNEISSCSLNYKMPYLDYMLIMTTGFDTQFKEIELSKGRSISDLNRKEVVIGDKVADNYFKTDRAIGKNISIFEEKYEVVGIVKKSNKIYIPYEPKLLRANWQKRIFRFDTQSSKVSYLLIENVESDLEALGTRVNHTVINRVKIYTYIDIIIFLILYILAVVIKKYYIELKKRVIFLKRGYDIQRRSIEWYKYLKQKKKDIAKVFRYMVVMIVIILIALKSLKYIELSQVVVPDNLFSLNSYIEIFKRLYSTLIYHLQYGFSDISIDVIFINIILFIIIMCSAFRKRRGLN